MGCRLLVAIPSLCGGFADYSSSPSPPPDREWKQFQPLVSLFHGKRLVVQRLVRFEGFGNTVGSSLKGSKGDKETSQMRLVMLMLMLALLGAATAYRHHYQILKARRDIQVRRSRVRAVGAGRLMGKFLFRLCWKEATLDKVS